MRRHRLRFSCGSGSPCGVPRSSRAHLGETGAEEGAWTALISGSGLAGILAGGLILHPFGGLLATILVSLGAH